MTVAKIATGSRPPLLPFLILFGLGAAGCATTEMRNTGETPEKPVQKARFTPAQSLPHTDADAQLQALGIQYKRVSDVESERGCQIENAVEITAIGNVKLTRPALLTQDMAMRLGRWVHEVLEPEAKRNFGSQLAAIDVGGSYSCRNIYGKPFGGRFAGHLSEHAYANAIDIGGFRLADGRDVEYLKNWRGPGSSSYFLQTSSLAACEIFNTTLTPDYDRYHRNHIHIDASPKKEGDTAKFCGVKGRFAPGAVPSFARYKQPGKKWKGSSKKHPVKKIGPAKKKRKATTTA